MIRKIAWAFLSATVIVMVTLPGVQRKNGNMLFSAPHDKNNITLVSKKIDDWELFRKMLLDEDSFDLEMPEEHFEDYIVRTGDKIYNSKMANMSLIEKSTKITCKVRRPRNRQYFADNWQRLTTDKEDILAAFAFFYSRVNGTDKPMLNVLALAKQSNNTNHFCQFWFSGLALGHVTRAVSKATGAMETIENKASHFEGSYGPHVYVCPLPYVRPIPQSVSLAVNACDTSTINMDIRHGLDISFKHEWPRMVAFGLRDLRRSLTRP